MDSHQRAPRILFFLHTSSLGGAEKSVIDIIQNLQKKDFSIRVILPNSNGKLVHVFKEMGIPVTIVDYKWWCSADSTHRVIQYYWMIKSLISVISFTLRYPAYIPDIVITNTLTIPWGMVYSRLVKKPHISLIREFGELDFGFSFLFGYDFSMKMINRFSDYVFTNSKTTKKHFKQYIDARKIDYFYPNIPEKSTVSKKTEESYFSSTGFKLLNLGSINEAKGQLDAIKAVLTLLDRGYTDIELLIAGHRSSQPYYERLQTAISYMTGARKNIKVKGFIHSQFATIDEADVVLVCSKHEAFGRITAEAMKRKKAIIATDSGANRELLEDGENALLYTPGDPIELADKIEYLYKNPQALKKFGVNAEKSYREELQPHMKKEKLYEVIERLTRNIL